MAEWPKVTINHGTVLHDRGWFWAVDDEDFGRTTGYALTTWGARRDVRRMLRCNEKMRRLETGRNES
jgi:hypothetical protein